MSENKNEYYNELLNFRIIKPEDWVFIPTQWAANFNANITFEDEEAQKAYEQAQQPFVSFYKPHEENNRPYPTVKCSVRSNEGLRVNDELEAIIYQCSQMVGYTIVEVSKDYILAGKRCMYAKMRIELENQQGEVMNCLSSIFLIPTPKYIFMIGLSVSEEEEFSCEAVFEEILKSIIV